MRADATPLRALVKGPGFASRSSSKYKLVIHRMSFGQD